MKNLIKILPLLLSSNLYSVDKTTLLNLLGKTIAESKNCQSCGVSVSVFTKDEIILQRGFGKKDKELDLEITPHTLFAIGSTTKAFTGLGIKLLENNKQLNIKDKVKKYLPEFKLKNDYITNEATIEDLLSHQIGLPRHDILWYLNDFDRYELQKKLQYLDFPNNAEKNFRKVFKYNNLLVTTAGIITEKVSGKTWEQYTQENILNPLQMTETFFGVPKNFEDLDIATPYYNEIKLEHKNINQVGPAGNMYSNAIDMTKWIQSLMQNKWEGISDLLTPRIPLLPGDKATLNYAYGLTWMINSMTPYKWYFHNGNIDGFSTLVFFSYDLNLGIVILNNQHSSSLPDEIVTAIILDELKNKPTNKSLKRSEIMRSFKTIDNSLVSENSNNQILAPLSKTYEHKAYGQVSLFEENNIKFINYNKRVWKLTPYDKDGFNFIEEDEFGFLFKISEDSVEIHFEPEVNNIRFE